MSQTLRPKHSVRLKLTGTCFGVDQLSASQQVKAKKPEDCKPVSALEIPDNCIRELDYVQLKTFLTLKAPKGSYDVDSFDLSDYHSVIRMINQKWA